VSATFVPAPAERERAGARMGVLAFATDPHTEAVLRDGLGAEGEVEVRGGDIREVTRALQRGAAPRVLVVDISGVAQPLSALGELSQLVEPDTRVLAIGDREDLALYRGLTRGLGVLEYLFKPLTREMVAAHFVPIITNVPGAGGGRVLRGGRLIAVTGTHGGVGATMIAANLAWVLAEVGRRHTLLLDGDLYGGTAATLLSARPAPGFRAALETPERVDDLFIDRTAQRLGERLHVLAGEGPLSDPPLVAAGAATRLLEALRKRFNVLVCDAPWPSTGIGRELYAAADQRILVTEPSLLGARDLLRYLAAPPGQGSGSGSGSGSAPAPLVVLNHVAGRADLSAAQFRGAVGRAPDLVIPHLRGAPREAANLGEPAAARVPRLRAAMEALALRAASVGVARRRRWGRR
jgi:pilus assembly protein CpaE